MQYILMTTFEFVNGLLLLSKYLTCERLLSHQVKNLEKNERRQQYLIQMFTLSAFQDKCTYIYIVFLLCLLDLLALKNDVKFEKKRHMEKTKG